MSVFIKRYKSKNDGTVIQVVFKHGRTVKRTIHIGTAHTDEQIDALVAMAEEIIHQNQMELDLFKEPRGASLVLESTHSKILWDTLAFIYTALGFDELKDEVFRQLVLAHIIEPTSKADAGPGRVVPLWDC